MIATVCSKGLIRTVNLPAVSSVNVLIYRLSESCTNNNATRREFAAAGYLWHGNSLARMVRLDSELRAVVLGTNLVMHF